VIPSHLVLEPDVYKVNAVYLVHKVYTVAEVTYTCMVQTDTAVRVSQETWQELNSRKRPGDTFEDVIRRLLEDG